MKTISELNAIRDRIKPSITLRKEDHAGTRIIVGMATCGLAAGARDTLLAFVEEVAEAKLPDVMISQTGCAGLCRLEPIVEITTPNEDKVTYVKVKPDMVPRIVKEHLINHKVVAEYTIGAAE